MEVVGVHGSIVERKSKEEYMMMKEKFVPFIEDTVMEPKVSVLERERVINQINTNRSDISVNKEHLNSMVSTCEFKGGMDVAIFTMRSRVHVFIVDPNKELTPLHVGLEKVGLIPVNSHYTLLITRTKLILLQMYPQKMSSSKTYESIQQFSDSHKDDPLPQSSLVILNNAFSTDSLQDQMLSLKPLIAEDCFVFINQVRCQTLNCKS